jgi:RHS repeat-associated protein
MPDGAQYRFSDNGNGTFTPPAGRHDTLVRNAGGTFTMTLQRSRSTYSFAADGSLTGMADDFGNVLTFTYDGNGRVTTVADASGSARTLSVAWNPQGRIADVSDSSSPARHIVYTYDADGTLIGVRDPVTPSGQQSTAYTYAPGRYAPVLSRITDRWGRVVSRLTWQTDGKLSSYTEGDYNDSNPAASTGEKYSYYYSTGATNKNSSMGVVSHSYTTNGLITDHAQYDASGNVLSSTDGAGKTTTYQYDARGNVSTMTRGGVTWSYTYDSNYPDQVSAITPGQTNFAAWKFDYNLPSETAPGALKRRSRYNVGRTYTQPLAEYVYDAHGRVTSVTDELGHVSAFQYNAAGDRIQSTVAGETTTYAYDGMGRMTGVTDALGHLTSYTYDALDRIATVRLPKPSPSSTLDFLTTYSYDNLDSGLVYVNVTDPSGRVTKTGYDALGHVVRTVDALGNATQFGYQYNLLKTITDANGNVTTYGYNSDRNLTSTLFPDGTLETLSVGYDGTVLSVTDRKGVSTGYALDSLGRVIGTATASYTYDGEKLASVSSGPVTMSYTYDDNWRLATETRQGEYTITYLPDAGLGGYTITPATSVPGPTLSVNYYYDVNGRLHQINSDTFGTFTIDYNALGQYSKITYPSGQTREFSYDDQGRLTFLANKFQGVPIATFQYDYDYNWSTNAYSMLGQRTSMTMAPPSPFYSTSKYVYDANYQLTSVIQSPNVYSWTYDAIGNRTSAYGVPYTYYKNGTNTQNGQRLRNDGGAADFTYDANGNMTGRAGQPLYAWDVVNRLTSNRGTTYAYDHLDRRVSATTSGVTTQYIPLGLNTIRERTGTSIRDYIFAPGIDEPLAKLENGALTNYSVDGLGSIVATTNNSGAVLSRIDYDPWGGTSTPQVPLFGFTGRETGAGGLWFLRARYYDPSIGRFLNEDPLQEHLRIATLATYRYAQNDPIIYADPFGLRTCVRGVTYGGRQVYYKGGPHWTGWREAGEGEDPHEPETQMPYNQMAAESGGYSHGAPEPAGGAFGMWPFFPQECYWVKYLVQTVFWKQQVHLHAVCWCPFEEWNSDTYAYGQSDARLAKSRAKVTKAVSFLGIIGTQCHEPPN